ncbi:MAG TPA: ATP-binding cassette domain-containing protein [Candidatus Limnocylindrales bacterium]|nr:ATP-binding cassette domain-containing protein [Candidatus Limnocylindrales bacterium]
MTPVVRAQGLGKRYGRRWALSECTVDIPAGRVVGIVGPNGAGKTTLLRLAVGQLRPTAGGIEVLGGRGAASRVGYVAQSTPVYSGLTVNEHLILGERLNPRWDKRIASERVQSAGLDLKQPAGWLSGGHRAQLALTMAVAKRPELLVIDEPLSRPRPARAPRVPSGPDGIRRRYRCQHHPLLARDQRPRADLRLSRHPRRLAGSPRGFASRARSTNCLRHITSWSARRATSLRRPAPT